MYVPAGYGTMFPYIFATDAMAYVDFLKRAFGAVELGRTAVPNRPLANARLRIGSTSFMVSQAGADDGFGPSRSAFYLYVEDADTAYRTALACGAKGIFAPQDMPYGDRQGGVTDPEGNTWWVSTRLTQESYD